jgi:hypothetical protein
MKTFLKRWAWLAAVVAVGAACVVLVEFHYTVAGPNNTFLYQHSRWTGETWVSIAGGQWQKL